jgi:putative hemolysin
MKKIYYILPVLFIVILTLFLIVSRKTTQNESLPINETSSQENFQEGSTTSLANPASKYCEENGGKLEIVTQSDGSQFGLCQLEDYSCEEWAYLNGECTIEEDAEKIKQALITKGLNLTDMKVVIYKHLGKYIGGGVVGVSVPAGGGYVFAVKEGEEIKILADGNGSIMCASFEGYPDFPSYLIPECVDKSGNPVIR